MSLQAPAPVISNFSIPTYPAHPTHSLHSSKTYSLALPLLFFSLPPLSVAELPRPLLSLTYFRSFIVDDPILPGLFSFLFLHLLLLLSSQDSHLVIFATTHPSRILPVRSQSIMKTAPAVAAALLAVGADAVRFVSSNFSLTNSMSATQLN